MKFWEGQRKIPPLFNNFYIGPGSGVIITAILKYTSMEAQRKTSLRFHIMELEVISQFISVFKGTLTPTTPITLIIILTRILFQMRSQIGTCRDLSWMAFWGPYESLAPPGKSWSGP